MGITSHETFILKPALTPVKVVATINQSGTYLNGPSNNGVEATFTYATGALTIDGESVLVNDRVLFQAQTNANENGIYTCTQEGATGVAAILQRSSDFQNIGQLFEGQTISVSRGTNNAGAIFVVQGPIPALFGISNLVLNSTLATPSTITDSTSSATPGTVRAFYSKITGSATTMTSGNLVGVRGEVTLVGASGGFLYGVQGKIIPTGTLSGSSWTAPVFAQFDISAATINAGQTAPVWADYGATGGTLTNVTGMRMFAGTNTIASLTLNSMIYLYGKATNLFELSGSASTYITTAAGTTIGGTLQKIAFTIDGVTYYLLAGTTIS